MNEKDRSLVELFLHSQNIKKYILGINKLTKSVQKFVEVDGIIDDFTRVQRSRKKSVLKIEEVPRDALILWVATGSPLEVKNRLDALGFQNISYLALCKYSDLPLVEPPFIMDFREDFLAHYESYKKVFSLLSDAKSKETFKKILNFKISFDYSFMQGFSNNFSEQYFDFTILPKFKNIAFFDAGGYVGDTAQEVIKNYPDFKKIWLVEPLANNIRIAKRELGDYKNIEFLPFGVGTKKERLFIDDVKSFSTIYGNGTQSVEIETIDNLIKEKVDFIKLDIEGAEQDAIEGAKDTILKYHPTLAICVYHKAEDWYRVPEKILAIRKDYKIYFRHYMEGIFESVMYFIPTTL